MLSKHSFPADKWEGLPEAGALTVWTDWTWDLLEQNGLTNDDGVALPGVTLAFGFNEARDAWKNGKEHPFLLRSSSAGEETTDKDDPPPAPKRRSRRRQRDKPEQGKSALGDPDVRRVAQHAYDLVKALTGGPLPESWIHRAARTVETLLKTASVSPDFLIRCLDWMSGHRWWSLRMPAFRRSALEQALLEFRMSESRNSQAKPTSLPAEDAERRKELNQRYQERIEKASGFWGRLLRAHAHLDMPDYDLDDPLTWAGDGLFPVLQERPEGGLAVAAARLVDGLGLMRYVDLSCPEWEEDEDAYISGKREIRLPPFS